MEQKPQDSINRRTGTMNPFGTQSMIGTLQSRLGQKQVVKGPSFDIHSEVDVYWTVQEPSSQKSVLSDIQDLQISTIYSLRMEQSSKNRRFIKIPDAILCTPDLASIETAYLFYYETLRLISTSQTKYIYIASYQPLTSDLGKQLKESLISKFNSFKQKCHSLQIPELKIELKFLQSSSRIQNEYQYICSQIITNLSQLLLSDRQMINRSNQSRTRIAVVMNKSFIKTYVSNTYLKKTLRLQKGDPQPLDIFEESFVIDKPRGQTFYSIIPLWMKKNHSEYKVIQLYSSLLNMNPRLAITNTENVLSNLKEIRQPKRNLMIPTSRRSLSGNRSLPFVRHGGKKKTLKKKKTSTKKK